MQPRDVILHTFANERLAAGDANFANPQAQENARQAVQLGPGENLSVVAVIFRVGRTAVHAAEVAAVGNRDTQVRNLAAEFVVKVHDLAPSNRCTNKKRLNPYAWMQAQTKKRTFSSSAPFQAGGPAVSSQTLIPGCIARRLPRCRRGC